MSPVRIGGGLAALVAGPPLVVLLGRGDIDVVSAVMRGAVVAVGCVVGASLLLKIIRGYERAGLGAARTRRDAAVARALLELDPRGPDGADRAPGGRPPEA